MLHTIRPYTGRSGVAQRFNQIIRAIERLEPQVSAGTLTSVTSRGTMRRVVPGRARGGGGEARDVWL